VPSPRTREISPSPVVLPVGIYADLGKHTIFHIITVSSFPTALSLKHSTWL